ncbi:MAG: hypothetical protein JWP35_4290 [Caulobacter sp.]|nr:hypothetical protein [Caulobacter sp.]
MTLHARITALALALAVIGLGVAAPVIALAAEPTAAASDEAKVRAVLTKAVNDAQGAGLDYDSMTPQLATAAKAQAAGMASLKSLGAVKAIERSGDATTPYIYKVTYEAGVTLTWEITLAADGKIDYLNAHQ